MDTREHQIFRVLLDADEPFYIPGDMSDVYALAPDSMLPGLMRFPGEYTGMSEEEVQAQVITAMQAGNWKLIPFSPPRDTEEPII